MSGWLVLVRVKTSRFSAGFAPVGKGLCVLLDRSYWWDAPGLKITQQALQSSLIGIVLFPLDKVSNMSLLTNSSCPCFGCLHNGLIQFDGEEHRLALLLLLLQGLIDLVFDPGTFDGMLRKDDDELVIHSDSLINVGSEFVSNFQIFGGIPAAHVFG